MAGRSWSVTASRAYSSARSTALPDARSMATVSPNEPERPLRPGFISVISTHPQTGLQSDQSIADAGLYGGYCRVQPFCDLPVREAAIVCEAYGLLLCFGQGSEAAGHGFSFQPASHFVRNAVMIDVLRAGAVLRFPVR